jgi:hypothetical protein
LFAFFCFVFVQRFAQQAVTLGNEVDHTVLASAISAVGTIGEGGGGGGDAQDQGYLKVSSLKGVSEMKSRLKKGLYCIAGDIQVGKGLVCASSLHSSKRVSFPVLL